MKRYVYAAALCLIAGGMSACAAAKTAQETEKPQAAVDVPAKQQTQVRKQTPLANEITPADFKRAVQTAVRNMVRSGALDNPAGERYVVTISHIVDTTKKNFDTADIKQKLSADLAASRKVRVVSASAKNVSPQINISGRITQRTAYVRSGKKRQEYYLHLVLTEAKSGIMLWENVTPVVKKNNQR